MKKTKIVISLIFMTSVFLFAGCQKKEEISKERYVWKNTEIPQTVKEKITEDITIDAKVRVLPGFEDGKADVWNVVRCVMDKENIFTVLSQGRKEFEEWTEEHGTETAYHYDFSDSSKLLIAKYEMNYLSELSAHLSKCVRLGKNEIDNNTAVFESAPKDLPFMTREEAQKNCYQMLSDLKREAYAEPLRSFSFEHTLLQEQEVVFDMGDQDSTDPSTVPKESWTEDDDCYYFEFLPMVEKCGIVPEAYVQSEKIAPVGLNEVIYGKNGVVDFRDSGQFEVEKVLEQEKPLLNYETALQKIKNYYENVMTDKSLTVKEIYLGYVFLFEEKEYQYQAEPAWVFKTENKNISTGYIFYENVVIDAVTGEEIS